MTACSGITPDGRTIGQSLPPVEPTLTSGLGRRVTLLVCTRVILERHSGMSTPPVTSLGVAAAPDEVPSHGERLMGRIPVYVHATDVISRAGIASQLRPRPEVLVLDEDELHLAAVALVVSENVGEETLRVLRALRSRGIQQIVLVAAQIDDDGMVAAVGVGVAGLLRRSEAGPDRLIEAITSAAAGNGSVSPDLLGRLLSQVGTLRPNPAAPRWLTFTGLADREVEVLRLVADGFDTAEIAERLSYSQRTIKTVLHDVTCRLHLRNRAHAVAYALRNGLI